jgi:hypothetical protein
MNRTHRQAPGERPRETGSTPMAVSPADMRAIVDRVCARPEVLDACARGDLGTVIEAFRTDHPERRRPRLAARQAQTAASHRGASGAASRHRYAIRQAGAWPDPGCRSSGPGHPCPADSHTPGVSDAYGHWRAWRTASPPDRPARRRRAVPGQGVLPEHARDGLPSAALSVAILAALHSAAPAE